MKERTYTLRRAGEGEREKGDGSSEREVVGSKKCIRRRFLGNGVLWFAGMVMRLNFSSVVMKLDNRRDILKNVENGFSGLSSQVSS